MGEPKGRKEKRKWYDYITISKKMRKISSWSKYIVWNYQIVNKKYCSKNCGQELSREFSRDLVKNV